MQCKLCAAILTIREIITYGGSRCEDCWAYSYYKIEPHSSSRPTIYESGELFKAKERQYVGR